MMCAPACSSFRLQLACGVAPGQGAHLPHHLRKAPANSDRPCAAKAGRPHAKDLVIYQVHLQALCQQPLHPAATSLAKTARSALPAPATFAAPCAHALVSWQQQAAAKGPGQMFSATQPAESLRGSGKLCLACHACTRPVAMSHRVMRVLHVMHIVRVSALAASQPGGLKVIVRTRNAGSPPTPQTPGRKKGSAQDVRIDLGRQSGGGMRDQLVREHRTGIEQDGIQQPRGMELNDLAVHIHRRVLLLGGTLHDHCISVASS